MVSVKARHGCLIKTIIFSMQYIYKYSSPLGGMTLASDGDAITGAWFDGQKYFGATLKGERREADLLIFSEAAAWLDRYFRGERPGTLPAIRLEGSAFRMAVWDILRQIPYGQVVTYGWIAEAIARKLGLKHMSAQAVGGAVGHNPVSVFVPCHRVVGSGGSLTGYAGGMDRKVRLLEIEGHGVVQKSADNFSITRKMFNFAP